MDKSYLTSSLGFAVIILHLIKGILGSFLTMWTHGQVVILNPGQNLELDCQFYSEEFSMFSNPVVWKKYQNKEQTEVNIMGNILEPFLSTGRFLVTFTNNAPHYRLQLQIEDLKQEDSGNYTCDIRGPRANILGTVTHFVFIRAAVESVHIYAFNETQRFNSYENSPNHQQDKLKSNSDIAISQTQIFLQSQPVRIQCIVKGGYPPPEITRSLGTKNLDVKGETNSVVYFDGSGGMKGLRRPLTDSESVTVYRDLMAEDDGKKFQCMASVPGLGEESASITVLVQHAPIVNCKARAAELGERDVFLSCIVRARPPLTSLYWQVGNNASSLSPSSTSSDQFWTTVMVRTDGLLETRLCFKKTTPSSYRIYTVHAENNIAVTSAHVELAKQIKMTKTSSPVPEAVIERRHMAKDQERASADQPTHYLRANSCAPSLTLPHRTAFIVFLLQFCLVLFPNIISTASRLFAQH